MSAAFPLWHQLVVAIGGMLRWIFLGAALLFALSFIFSKHLPPRAEILTPLLKSPIQLPTKKAPFEQFYRGVRYQITPKFQYELWGLVVSSRDLGKTWYNYLYKSDPLVIKDLCVIWGGNLTSDDYREMSYESGLWTCYVQYRNGLFFAPDALANNHLLPATKDVARVLAHVERGDQVHLQGMLVDYVDDHGARRSSSITRADTGNGACEVIFTEMIEIMKSGNVLWRAMAGYAKLLMLFSALFWIYDHFVHPHERFQKR